MKLDHGFLIKPIKDWPLDDGYCKAKQIDSSKKEENLQNVLQTVENDRSLIPNQRNRNLTSGRWSLKLD